MRIDVDALLSHAEQQRDEERVEGLIGVDQTSKKRKLDGTQLLETARKKPKPPMQPHLGPEYATSSPLAHLRPEPSKPSRIRLLAPPVTPCCLCASDDRTGLLRVLEPPAVQTISPPPPEKDAQGHDVRIWRAHELCAKVIPETWIDEYNGERVVFGVDGIDKDRWNLVRWLCTWSLYFPDSNTSSEMR